MLATHAEIKSGRSLDTKCYIRFIIGKIAGANLILDDAAYVHTPAPQPQPRRAASFTCNEDE
jgi:hypothetical protein